MVFLAFGRSGGLDSRPELYRETLSRMKRKGRKNGGREEGREKEWVEEAEGREEKTEM